MQKVIDTQYTSVLFFIVFANQNPRLRSSRQTQAAVSLFPRIPIPVSPLLATDTSRQQITENTNTLSPAFATHTDFAPVTPVFATHTKTTGVCSNNSHSGTHSCPSRFLCDLGVSALNPILSPSTFNPQLLISFLSRDLSFHALTNCPFSISFVLTFMHRMGGVGGGVQKFLKNYFNSGRISIRIKRLQRADFTSHQSRITSHEPPVTVSSIQSRNRVPFIPPPMQIVHRNVQVNFAARRLDADHQRFRVRASAEPFVVHVDFRRKHFEVKPLVVQQRHRISDDHVRQFTNRFARHLLARFNFHSRKLARHFDRHFRRQIQNDAPFDISLDGDERRDALAPIRIFLHCQVHDFRRRLQRLREDRVRGVNERLDQFHSHERCSPASATGAPTALGSSLSTYRRISYSTS